MSAYPAAYRKQADAYRGSQRGPGFQRPNPAYRDNVIIGPWRRPPERLPVPLTPSPRDRFVPVIPESWIDPRLPEKGSLPRPDRSIALPDPPRRFPIGFGEAAALIDSGGQIGRGIRDLIQFPLESPELHGPWHKVCGDFRYSDPYNGEIIVSSELTYPPGAITGQYIGGYSHPIEAPSLTATTWGIWTPHIYDWPIYPRFAQRAAWERTGPGPAEVVESVPVEIEATGVGVGIALKPDGRPMIDPRPWQNPYERTHMGSVPTYEPSPWRGDRYEWEVSPETLRAPASRASSGPAQAALPRGGVRPGVKTGPAPGKREPPGRLVHERKADSSASRKTWRAIGHVTEVNDALSAVYKALPGRLRAKAREANDGKALNPIQKAELLYQNLNAVNIQDALVNLLVEGLEDKIYGGLGRLSAKASAQVRPHGDLPIGFQTGHAFDPAGGAI